MDKNLENKMNWQKVACVRSTTREGTPHEEIERTDDAI